MHTQVSKKKHIMWITVFILVVVSCLLIWKIFFLLGVSTDLKILSKQFRIPSQPTQSSVQPSIQPLSSGVAQSTLLPSSVLNLTNWKITLPLAAGNNKTSPMEIKQPDLATYRIYPLFGVSSDGKGVVFHAPVTGVTTSGSKYPRSELREMTNNGRALASWSSSTGKHTMFIDEAITAIPKVKKQIVAGQIHDATSYVIFIRLNYPVLFVSVDGKNVHTLDDHYTLGKRFTVQFVVHNNSTDIYYNNSANPVYSLKKKFNNSYFKAGAYTQSNCSTEKNPSLCNVNDFGEVVIYRLEVTHQ